MKVSEWTPAAICQINTLDIEVLKAQRLQELKDLAEYRQRHMAMINLWSKDRDAVYAQLKVDPTGDTAALKAQTDLQAECVRFNVKPIKITPIVRLVPPKPPLKWWQRLLSAIDDLIERLTR